MSIWAILVPLIIIKVVLITLACVPNAMAEWVTRKFELHPKLSAETVTITIDEKQLEEDEKNQIVNFFNQAIYLDRYGYLPEKKGTPLIIDTKVGKDSVRFALYFYNDRIDVFKESKKKVTAYYLSSKTLSEHSIFSNFSLVSI